MYEPICEIARCFVRVPFLGKVASYIESSKQRRTNIVLVRSQIVNGGDRSELKWYMIMVHTWAPSFSLLWIRHHASQNTISRSRRFPFYNASAHLELLDMLALAIPHITWHICCAGILVKDGVFRFSIISNIEAQPPSPHLQNTFFELWAIHVASLALKMATLMSRRYLLSAFAMYVLTITMIDDRWSVVNPPLFILETNATGPIKYNLKNCHTSTSGSAEVRSTRRTRMEGYFANSLTIASFAVGRSSGLGDVRSAHNRSTPVIQSTPLPSFNFSFNLLAGSFTLGSTLSFIFFSLL